MPRTVKIKKIGALVKIQDSAYPGPIIIDRSKAKFEYKTGNKINCRIEDYSSFAVPITYFSIEGVAVTDETDFDTRLATVFPNAGTSASTTIIVDADTDFTTELTAYQTLEYFTYFNVTPSLILIGTTNGGNDILPSTSFENRGFAQINYTAAQTTETIYFSGIQYGSKLIIKKS